MNSRSEVSAWAAKHRICSTSRRVKHLLHCRSLLFVCDRYSVWHECHSRINSSSRAPHPCCARVPAQASPPCVPSAPSDRVPLQPVPSSFPRASRHGLSIDGAMPARMEGRANLRIPVQTRGRRLGERCRLRLRVRRLPALRAKLRASARSSVAALGTWAALGTSATWAART